MSTTTPSEGVAMPDALEQMRVLVVAGITTGVVVVSGAAGWRCSCCASPHPTRSTV